jgi:serine/threonine protein kinase
MISNCDLLECWLSKRAQDRSCADLGRLAPGTVLGEWRIEVYLGSGLSAEVYRVTNVRMQCEGALKLLVDETRGLKERFIDEADAMRYLALPSIPRFLGSGEYGGAPYYVMEYLHPVDERMSGESFSRLMVKIADAVHELHDAGFIHRDLKPGNIMRRANGEVVLIDLGLLKRKGSGVTDPIVRHGKSLSIIDGRPVGVGTLDYAAPEQLLKGEFSVASDVFSLGKILQHFYGGKVPRKLRYAVRRATRDAPADRFPSAKAFAAAIRRRHYPAIVTMLAAAGLVAAAAAYPLWKPVAFDLVRTYVAPPPKVLGELMPRKDENDADYFRRIAPLAAEGNIEAQIALAEAHFYGRGTATNRPEAVRWYMKAAKAGDPSAQASLGLCAFHGWGCEKDRTAAVRWYESAANAGSLGAMSDLAYCYLQGFGVEKDPSQGFGWAMRAAERGHHPAQTMVAECYLEGIGVEKNIERAETWLYRAARLGNKRALMLLQTR